MSLTLAPNGRLHVALDATASGPNLLAPLRESFDRSNAEGLIALAGDAFDRSLPAEGIFWRGIVRELLQRLCQLGDGVAWASLPEPTSEEFATFVGDAPPMKGLEYLTVEFLAQLWRELLDHVDAAARAHPDGPAAWLQSVNPVYRQLGRVTFHLAENKKNPSRPFAFLATFPHRLSSQSKLQHLPLAEALKTYAGAKEQAKLAALLEPVTRAAEVSPLAAELLESRALFAPQAWTIREAHRFLTEAPRIEQSGVVVRLPNWWSARTPPRPQVQVAIGQRRASAVGLDQLLDFHVDLAIDGEPLTEAERRQLMASTDGLVLLRGKWVEADRERLQQALDHWKSLERDHAQGIDFITGMRLLAGAKLDAAEDDTESTADWSQVHAGDWLKETLDRLRHPETIDECQPGRDLQATLRPYQIDGVRWLWFMTELGLGGCLADDMGLGKTIQIIDLLLIRKRRGTAPLSPGSPGERGRTPCLLVAPASLIGNWKRELERFAPTLRVFYAHRSESSAEDLDRIAKNPTTELADVDLVVTTYGLARRQAWLEKVRWGLVVLDEAQAIKNSGSTQTRAVKKLKSGCRLALTGTPVENHLGDLWSLFDFCCPGLLGNAAEFKRYVKRISDQQDAHAFGAVRRLVRPYLLRRLKTDPNIVPDLPDKTEMRTECGLGKRQAALYERAVADLAKRLEKSDGIARRGIVLASLMQLKQICNHPSQYLGVADFAPDDSGKFERLKLLAEPIAERQEKVLVFTQFQSLTRPLADFLATVFGRDGLVLDGGTAVKKRGELVAQFQDPDGPPFFVISLKAGGSGLNLTAANHVVHFDRWWNPAVENQATDRAFRIGQKRNVLVHKFVCRGTVEERIDEMIASKQQLADQILDHGGETLLTEMNDDELLRFVALDIGRATAE